MAVRGRLGLVALLLVLAGLAWWLTAERMAGMDAGPGTSLGTLGWFLGVWVVMMAAMMFPAVAPTVAPGAYQLTALKDVCLRKCRSPLGFLLGAWHEGGRGALGMGARHASWCLGCCWALMAALFALGVMSLAWMALVAALITLEKTLPWRRVALWGTTAILLVLAVGLIAAPEAVPALVMPGDKGAVHAMHSIGAMR